VNSVLLGKGCVEVGGFGECVQCAGTERIVVCKGELMNVYSVLVRKGMWGVRGSW
jgi:hypothetical protein